MTEEVTGNTQGLKASELKALERLYRRRVAPTEIVSAELAAQLAEQAAELHRQVGVLIDRRGAIQHVIVGDASKLVLALPERPGQGGSLGRSYVPSYVNSTNCSTSSISSRSTRTSCGTPPTSPIRIRCGPTTPSTSRLLSRLPQTTSSSSPAIERSSPPRARPAWRRVRSVNRVLKYPSRRRKR